MRLKVQTASPLPLLKAWFTTHPVPSILHLKAALCTELAPLVHGRVHPRDILLLLDDFELLDASPIDVVRDGDLVLIKKRPLIKRKASVHDAASPARKRLKTHESPVPSSVTKRHTSTKTRAEPLQHSSSSSDSSSDSDSESEDDSSSSDSDSDTDTSSSSRSSSSTSSAQTRPSAKPIANAKNVPAIPYVHIPRRTSPRSPATIYRQGPPVPPGLGKPTTHSRNLRRRRKKMFERIALTAEPSSVNEIPLGTRAQTLEQSPVAADDDSMQHDHIPQRPGTTKEKEEKQDAEAAPAFMMASLQNKNKRRGFKNALSHGVPAKIVFAGGAEPQEAADAQTVEAALTAPPAPPSQHGLPRLVPPSEKQKRGLLPENLLVTSVDVEEGLWPARGKNKKKKKMQAPVDERYEEQEEANTFAGGLPYDDVPEDPAPSILGQARAAGGSGSVAGSTEREVVAAKWDTLRKITEKAQVQVGATLAWKALGINYATFTPEILLHLGRVARADEKLVLEPFADPSAVAMSFDGATDGEESNPVEETVEWADVFQGDWRLVSAR
ncbi:hypothetical protein BC628DRAFT_1315291 [Trametes gibbosa]|nr:hypothetical protein BC628DRAFT_1315291 [Trametes gibbosa]